MKKNIRTKKYIKNLGKPWVKADIQKIRQLKKGNTPTRIIGLKLGRSVASIYKMASKNKISLKPTNQSPYNRRKKRRK